jgi:S-DNA-T family DNA segregation ATPase FtsK/SpoIIIE
VRDVLIVQRDRLALALMEDAPRFVPMGRDERVLRDHYNDQRPAVVVDQLEAAADALAVDFADLRADQWQRTGIYNWPEESPRSMVWLGQHTIHEERHHLHDIDDVLARLG